VFFRTTFSIVIVTAMRPVITVGGHATNRAIISTLKIKTKIKLIKIRMKNYSYCMLVTNLFIIILRWSLEK